MTNGGGVAASQELAEIDVGFVLRRLGRGWAIILVTALLFIALALGGMRLVTPTYTAEATIAPALDLSGAKAASKHHTSTATISLGSGFSLGMARDPTFSRYLSMLTSRRVSQRLVDRHPEVLRRIFYQRWDERKRQWRAPTGPVAAIAGALKDWLRFPPPHSPDARDLAAFLAKKLSVSTDTGTMITTVSITHPDSRFAQEFLAELLAETDAALRDEAADNLQKQIKYVNSVLPTLTDADQRNALTGILSDSQKLAIMVEPDVPYAMAVIDPPSCAAAPSSPKPLLFLAAAAMTGLLVGAVVVLRREARRGK